MQGKTYFIYRYVRLDTNVPFYIGMGTKQEVNSQGYPLYSWQSIYGRAYSKDRNYVCSGIMNKVKYDIEVMYETSDLFHAEEKEKEFIKMYGIVYDGTGTLTNLTKGGRKFEPTTNYSARSVSVRKKRGKLNGINSKAVFMYDADGTLVDSLPSVNGFYKKYKFGDKDGQTITDSIKNKRSSYGYYFSFSKFDVLDLTEYKKRSFDKYPIIKYVNGVISYIYMSYSEASRDFGVSTSTIKTKIRNSEKIGNSILVRTKIHQLHKFSFQ